MIKWKYVAAWFPGVIIAIANGMVRQFGLQQFLTELQAHQLSVLTFSILFGVYVWYILGWLNLHSGKEAFRVGFLWLALTISFEFLFGHYVMGHPWDRLLHDYNLFEGRLWVVVLAWITVAPFVLSKMRREG